MTSRRSVVLSAPVRTAIGTFGGSLKGVAATELGAAAIAGTLARTGLAACDVGSVVMGNVEDNIRKLSILRGMGVTVAIDDFGTGYSSLSYLSKLPLDSLKIDRSFVSRMTGSAEAASIVSTIITLDHGLKLKVIAEGVETEEQSQSLTRLGCDEAQGFLFAKPLPGANIEALLRERDGRGLTL